VQGLSHLAVTFQMCVFRPESTLNAKRNADYAAVRLRVMRQVY
jgi:type I restriction enzyme R subunit